MVKSAEEDEVVHIGGAAVGPVPDVVTFGPGGGFAAARERAAVIAGSQRAFLFGGDGSGGAGEVEWVAVLVHHDGGEKAITRQLAGGVAGERSHPGQPPDRRAVTEQVPICAAVGCSITSTAIATAAAVFVVRFGCCVGVDGVAGVDVDRICCVGLGVGFCCCA